MDETSWPSIRSRAEKEGVLAALASAQPHLPGRAEIRKAAAADHLDRLRLTLAAQKAIAPLNIPWALLKGLALSYRLYDDPSDRPSGDCDILVRPEDRATAARALERAGFHATKHHGELFCGTPGQIDLHTAFVNAERIPARAGVRPTQPDWPTRVVPLETEAGCWPVLHPDDLALYLVLHLVHHHGAGGARWILDLYRLDRKHPEWRRMVRSRGADGQLAIDVVDACLGNGFEGQGSSLLDRIAVRAAWEGRAIPALRFLLSAREISSWSERISFVRQALIPSRDTLASSTMSEKGPALGVHLERIGASARALLELGWSCLVKKNRRAPVGARRIN